MTSASAQRPTAAMTTAARPSRFSNFASMANANEKPAQSIGSSFTNSSWTPPGAGIWGNSTIGGFGRRDTAQTRGPEDAFSNAPSGSGALVNTSEAENPWATRPGPWNTQETAQARNPSGNTSPNRQRQTTVQPHDLSATSQYYPSQPQVQQAFGQRPGNVSSTSRPNSALDPSSNAFKYSSFSEYADEKENGGPFGLKIDGSQGLGVNGFKVNRQESQDSSYLGLIGASSRNPSITPSNHSDVDPQTQNNSFADFGYASHAPNAVHAHRPSVNGPSLSFSQTNRQAYAQNLANQMAEEELQDKLERTLSLSDGANGATNGISYNTATQPFQFNPGSQPWEDGQGYQIGFAKDVYADALGAPYSKRGSIVDRGSPAGSAYRPLTSPKSYSGTPQPGMDSWPRPTSRDLRLPPELDRRTAGQNLLHQQTAQYFPPPYYNPNYQQFPPHLYELYGQGYRAPVPISPYGLPINPYIASNAAVSIRANKDADPAKGVRSVLLEEFRSSAKSNKRYELKDIYQHIVEFSGDQHGSRFIQQKLETANSDEKDQVFREIEPNAVQLMKDVFGNYVIQKFFEHGNQVQKKVLAGVMKGKVVDLSMQMYACRVVQKALEHVLVEQQAELAKELESDVLKIVKDQNGNHVVQKIIELVPRHYIGFIMDCFRGRVSELSSHTYGCRVIQRVLEYGTEADKAVIMDELHSCSQFLITDQYGNYVTQHVIQHGKPDDRSRMINIVINQLVTLSKHKFASNVVEKCIEYGTPDERRHIRTELTTIGPDGNSPLQLMMKDQYGNYVIQKLLNQLDGPDRESFIEEMKPQFMSLKKASTGRQIAAIDRLISAVSSPIPSTKAPTPSSSAPASPALQVDLSSAAPTPNLTMEPNSPSSSSPPSTTPSAVGEAAEDRAKVKGSAPDEAPCPEVRVDEA